MYRKKRMKVKDKEWKILVDVYDRDCQDKTYYWPFPIPVFSLRVRDIGSGPVAARLVVRDQRGTWVSHPFRR